MCCVNCERWANIILSFNIKGELKVINEKYSYVDSELVLSDLHIA